MAGIAYLSAASLAAACIVVALFLASRDYPRNALLRSSIFFVIMVLALIHPLLAWRLAGFARPSNESDLPSEFQVLGVADDGEKVSLWFRTNGVILAYSFVPHKRLHDALATASRDLLNGKQVVLEQKPSKDKDASNNDVGTNDAMWKSKVVELLKKEE